MLTRRSLCISATAGLGGLVVPWRRLQAACPAGTKDCGNGNSTWCFFEDDVQIEGVVDSHEYSGDAPIEDHDWNLNVAIDPNGPYACRLNNKAGRPNDKPATGIIQCEIAPTGSHGGGNNEKKYFDRLKGKPVTVVGAFVEDTNHDNKTEIHPISWISCLDWPYYHVFAFSNDPAGTPGHPDACFSNKNRCVRIDLPFDQLATPLYSVEEEVPDADLVWYQVHTIPFNVTSLTAPS